MFITQLISSTTKNKLFFAKRIVSLNLCGSNSGIKKEAYFRNEMSKI